MNYEVFMYGSCTKAIRDCTRNTMLQCAGIMMFVFAVVETNKWTLYPNIVLAGLVLLAALVFEFASNERYYRGKYFLIAHHLGRICLVNAFITVLVGIYLTGASS